MGLYEAHDNLVPNPDLVLQFTTLKRSRTKGIYHEYSTIDIALVDTSIAVSPKHEIHMELIRFIYILILLACYP